MRTFFIAPHDGTYIYVIGRAYDAPPRLPI